MSLSLVRFFAAWTRNAWPVFVLMVATGGTLWYLQGPAPAIDNTLGLALVIQMFAASTGFRQPARLGQFDLPLTRTYPRWHVVAAHMLVSVAPVAIAWVVIAAVDVILLRRGWPLALTIGPLAALVWVSAAAWSVGAWLGRHSAGALWLLAIFVIGASGAIRQFRDAYLAPASDVATEAWRVGATLALPFFTFADATVVTGTLALGVMLAAGIVLACAAGLLARAEIPLRMRA